MRRLNDQFLILDAISNVRRELRHDMPMKDAFEVMMRLTTLYSLLNVEQIKTVVEQVDDRENNIRKVA